MQKEASISIIKTSESTEYTGKVIISDISDSFMQCSYELYNQLNPNQRYSGEFEGKFMNMAQIIEKINSIVNSTVPESYQ